MEDQDSKEPTAESKVVCEKTYTIKWIEYADGTCMIHRRNDGFNSYELLGLVTQAKKEITRQIRGELKPAIVKREVVQE